MQPLCARRVARELVLCRPGSGTKQADPLVRQVHCSQCLRVGCSMWGSPLPLAKVTGSSPLLFLAFSREASILEQDSLFLASLPKIHNPCVLLCQGLVLGLAAAQPWGNIGTKHSSSYKVAISCWTLSCF